MTDSNKNVSNKQIKKIAQNLDKSIKKYRGILSIMGADAPIGMLCLPSSTEKILINNGILRIYDLFNLELSEIKGLGTIRIRDITTRLNQFVPM